jgi:hypothetical protein
MTSDDGTDLFRDQQRLKRNPTIRSWKREIDYVLQGKRHALVLEIGSHAQYVARLLADSHDPEKAMHAFEQAIEAKIRFWRPGASSHEYNLALFELIAEFNPPNGFPKIVGALQKWGALSPRQLADPEANQTTILKALRALELYYPSRPPLNSNDRAFDDYAGLLLRFAGKPFYAPHCCRRSIELGLIDVNNDRQALREMLEMPGVVEEFLQYALGIHRGMLEGSLGYVLDCCLSAYDSKAHAYPLYDRFKAELRRLGAEIRELERRALFLSFAKNRAGNDIELLISDRTFAKYEEASHKEAEQLIREKFASYAERAPAWNENT